METTIPMRDGRSLAASVYLPRAAERSPAVLIQTPYGRDALVTAIRKAPMGRLLFESGRYACVVMDWRGFHGSSAARDPKPSLASRGRDGHDAVEWVAAQPWCDGKVGTWGPSALGVAQFQTALERPPHLVCCVPVVAHLGVGHAQYYCGGVLRNDYVDALEQLGFGIAELVRAHPVHDGFWRSIEVSTRPERIDVPMLIVGGWYDLSTDELVDTFRTIRKRGGLRARSHTRLLLGPWQHSAVGARRQGEIDYAAAQHEDARTATRFLGRWLRGEENGWDAEPAARWFQMDGSENGGGAWRSGDDLPEAAREAAWYLGPGGRLAQDAPGAEDRDSFVSDPADPVPTWGGGNLGQRLVAGPLDQRRKVESRDDVLVYTTELLEEPVVLCGAARAVLFVSSDRTDTDIAVRLCDVYPDGRSVLVTDGIRRMRFRNSLEREELMEPGEVYEVEVELPVMAITFARGHRVRVSISSSSWPRFGVNPQNGANRFDPGGGVVARNGVHHGVLRPSRVCLPVPGG